MLTAIIDYGSGNLHSAYKAFEKITASNNLGSVIVTSDPKIISSADRLVLPGDGAFPSCKSELMASEAYEALVFSVVEKSRPFLGICVGMQIMASGSEVGNKEGLGWFNTEVCKFKSSNIHYPLPHMGWNSLNIHTNSILFSYLNDKKIFYFLHSYHFKSDYKHTIATSNYSTDIGAVIKRDNIFGIQCHPEKSHYNGVTLLKNFYEL